MRQEDKVRLMDEALVRAAPRVSRMGERTVARRSPRTGILDRSYVSGMPDGSAP
jgi:hypothetical protein